MNFIPVFLNITDDEWIELGGEHDKSSLIRYGWNFD